MQVHGQAAQVPGVNGAGSKTGAGPAPRIGLLRYSDGAGSRPKMEPAPFTQGTCAIGVLVGFFATPQPSRCTYKKTASQRGFDVRTTVAVALMRLIIR